MYKICIFGGTTEGRRLLSFLLMQPVKTTYSTATEYGEEVLDKAENLTVLKNKLSAQEMEMLFAASRFDMVVDATHPYAADVTENISSACMQTKTAYLRLLRADSNRPRDAVIASDIQEAIAFLNKEEGNILLTTGSKELAAFAVMEDFASRVYARVLPSEASLALCRAAGLTASHILAMQGPFSEEMNIAMLRSVSARILVTKDGGDIGGFGAKAAAAQKMGVTLLVLGRPPQKEGVSFSEAVHILCRRFGFTVRPQVTIVGIGPGGRGSMTEAAQKAIAKADCLIGAERMLECAEGIGQCRHAEIAPDKIAAYIHAQSMYQHFAVLMSGDTGFFSGTKKLLPCLSNCTIDVLPGISTLAYFCARLQISYEDVVTVSLHGRKHAVSMDVRENARVFVLVGGANGVNELCHALIAAKLENVQIYIGERLGYPDEKITKGLVKELADGTFDALSAVLIENDTPNGVISQGLPDAAFSRGRDGDKIVPMTKSEVRAICLSKLCLTRNAVCWDIGAGTGSVTVEMARAARSGKVFAIEKNEMAVRLLKENAARLSSENTEVIEGTAPDACINLPIPTHAFIGGSTGNMKEIIRLLLKKNATVRIVATAISLETVAELQACMREFSFAETEVVCVSIARTKTAGQYHMLRGENPVYIFVMQNKDKKA